MAAAGRALEWQQFCTHIARHFGRLNSFLFTDPDDSSVTDHGFAVGDGVTTAFQLQRTLAGDIIDAAGFEYTAQTKPYTNLVKNSSFETDTNADGAADNWQTYNNAAATEPSQLRIVPGMNGGKAQRISWGINTTSSKGITQTGVSTPAWVTGQWYTISFFARASGTNLGKFMSLGWNTAPSTGFDIANPALTASWQRYVYQVFWNNGSSPTAEIYFTISSATSNAYANTIPSGTFGDLDFDLVQVTTGQYGVADLQPFETPAAATGTRTPSYWPATADGFEPVFDLNGDTTFFEDGTWRGRRQLYPYTRTNLVPFSEQFDNAAWTKTNATITANSTTAPDGTVTGDTFSEGAAVTVLHFAEQTIAAETAGELRCYSVFVKAGSLPNITFLTNAANTFLNFNLTTGVIFSTGSELVASGVTIDPRWPGWSRIWFVHRATTLASTIRLLGQADGTYSGTAYTGTNRTFFAWGAMAERVSNLSGPTPYIPTPSSSTVTTTDYTLSTAGVFQPVAVPAAGTYYSWSGAFYRRCRFDMDAFGTTRLFQSMYEARSVQLLSVK
jgi:hypothetical protein